MAPKPKYMFQRYRRWWFRIAVPSYLQPTYGKARQENLDTDDYAVAQVRALQRAAYWKTIFNSGAPSSPVDFHGPRDAYLSGYAEVRRAKDGLGVNPQGYNREEQEHVLSTHIDLVLDAEAARQGVDDPSEIEEGKTTPEFRAKLDGMKDALAGRGIKAPAAAEPFSKLATRYIASRQREGAAKRLTEQSVGQLEATYRLYRDHCSDAPLSEANSQSAARFVDKLEKLGVHWGRSPETKMRDLDALVELSERAGGRRLSGKTIFRHMVALGQLWEWAKPREDLQGDNPFSGLVKKDTTPSDQNDPWPDAALRHLLYDHPDGSSEGKPDPFYWIPRICLLSGMRPDEACQLEVENIKVAEGVRYFDIVASKTSAGVRVVPLHSDLEPLLKMIPRSGYIFPDLTPGGPDGKRWWNISKVIGRRLRRIEGATTFYGLRKNVAQAFEREHKPESEVAQIMGHGKKGITYRVYSPNGLRIDQKRDLIALLTLPPREANSAPDETGPAPEDPSPTSAAADADSA